VIHVELGGIQVYKETSARAQLDNKRQMIRALESVGEIRLDGRGENASLTVTMVNHADLLPHLVAPPETLEVYEDGDLTFSGTLQNISLDSSISLSVEA
jgi:hypothetical protein